MDNNEAKIYTIGHSNNSLEHLTKLLKENNVKVLLDVRSHPYSKFVPQFNRENLERESKRLRFEYRFAGDYLGGKPEDKSCYDGNEVNYDKIASKDYYKKGINRLIEISQESVTAILCSEENPHMCHRHKLIAQTLLDMGVEVLHIRHNGQVEKAEIVDKQLSFI
jgi:uncharacterized protein (DUF488 family)